MPTQVEVDHSCLGHSPFPKDEDGDDGSKRGSS
jgi:hypothetical protein